MAAEWETARIGDIFDLVGGYAFKSGEFLENGIPVIKIKNVKANRMLLDDLSYVSADFLKTRSDKIVQKGDLLITMSGNRFDGSPDTWVGKVAQFNEDGPFLLNQRVGILRPKRGAEIYSRFFAFSLSSQFYQNEFIAIATSSGGQANLSPSQILGAPIELPTFTEQKAIAHVLGTLDDKIELNRKMNVTLEAMARALFKSWFVDFDPVRAKLDGRQPAGMDAATAALFPEHLEDSPLGHIPKGWKVIGLPEAIDFLEGPGLRNWQYRDEGMKFLNIRCIVDGDLDIAKANCISLEEFEKTYRHFALQTDDIVISTSGTLGRLAIVRADHLPVMLNTSIIRMRGFGAVGLGYVWGFLQSEYFLAEMFALAAGSVQLNFGPMHLRQISILQPPDGILEGFERVVQPLLRECLQLRKESCTLANLRDTLLPKLLSGELSVPEAMKEVAGV